MAPTVAHCVSLPAPPRGPLRLWPGEAGSTAPAGGDRRPKGAACCGSSPAAPTRREREQTAAGVRFYSLSLRERAGASRCGSRSACALLDGVKKVGLSPACGLQDRAPRLPGFALEIPTLTLSRQRKREQSSPRSLASRSSRHPIEPGLHWEHPMLRPSPLIDIPGVGL